MRGLLGCWLGAVCVGCGAGEVERLAWRTGAAAWPGSSAAGLEASLEALAAGEVDAVHVDLFLASDRVPVGSREAFLDTETCTDLAGQPVPADTWLFLEGSESLSSDFLCGASPDPDFPEQAALAAPPLLFAELLAALEEAPPTTVVLEARWFPNVSHAPEVYAAELLERWAARELSHHELRVASEQAVVLAAVQERAPAVGLEVQTWLVWPRRPPLGWVAGVAGRDLLLDAAGAVSPVAQALDARADGLVLGWDLAERGDVIAASEAGLMVGLQVGAGATAARQASRWPVDTVWSPELSW